MGGRRGRMEAVRRRRVAFEETLANFALV